MHHSLFPAGICVGTLDEECWRHVSVHFSQPMAPGWCEHVSGVPWLYYSIAPCVWLVKSSSSHAGMLGKFEFKILTSLRRAPGPFRSGHLSGWHETIQRQVWSCSEMCLNLCHVLVWWVWNWSFSAFVYTYWLQVMEHLDCHDTMDWSLESPAPLVKRPVCWFVIYVKNDKVGVTHMSWHAT